MKKNTMLKVINPVLAVLIVTQALSALLCDQLSLDAFEVIHEGGGLLLVAASALHLILNWPWVRTNLLPKHGA
jgi:hypothetical protein